MLPRSIRWRQKPSRLCGRPQFATRARTHRAQTPPSWPAEVKRLGKTSKLLHDEQGKRLCDACVRGARALAKHLFSKRLRACTRMPLPPPRRPAQAQPAPCTAAVPAAGEPGLSGCTCWSDAGPGNWALGMAGSVGSRLAVWRLQVACDVLATGTQCGTGTETGLGPRACAPRPATVTTLAVPSSRGLPSSGLWLPCPTGRRRAVDWPLEAHAR